MAAGKTTLHINLNQHQLYVRWNHGLGLSIDLRRLWTGRAHPQHLNQFMSICDCKLGIHSTPPQIPISASSITIKTCSGLLIEVNNNSQTKEKRRKGKKGGRRIQTNSASGSKTSFQLPSRNSNYSTIMTGYCPELVDDFEELADDLRPPKKFIKAGRQAAFGVFQLLKKEVWRHNLRIDRTKIAGSIGKGTAIWYDKKDGTTKYPDFDCVAFLNDVKPPFETILQAFVQILGKHRSISNIRTTKRTVQFLYDLKDYGKIKFDLLPAANFVKQLDGDKPVGEQQARLALEDLTLSHNNTIRTERKIDLELNKFYSSSFNENTVQRINEYVGDEFVLNVVRLAKWWNSNLEMDKMNFPARSCIIERVAIYAQQGKRTGRTCLISGFRRFLEAMANFGSLHVRPEGGIKNKNNPKAARELAIASTSMPIITEPTNYFYNLADGIKKEAVEYFESQAQETLSLLEDLKSREGYGSVENAIDVIFWHK